MNKETRKAVTDKLREQYENDKMIIFWCERKDQYAIGIKNSQPEFYERMGSYISAGLYDTKDAQGEFGRILNQYKKSKKGLIGTLISNAFPIAAPVNSEPEVVDVELVKDNSEVIANYKEKVANKSEELKESYSMYNELMGHDNPLDALTSAGIGTMVNAIKNYIIPGGIHSDVEPTPAPENVTVNVEDVTVGEIVENIKDSVAVGMARKLANSVVTKLSSRSNIVIDMKLLKNYISNNMKDVVIANVDPSYRDIVESCFDDIEYILLQLLDIKEIAELLVPVNEIINDVIDVALAIDDSNIIVEPLKSLDLNDNDIKVAIALYDSILKINDSNDILNIIVKFLCIATADDIMENIICNAGARYNIEDPVMRKNISIDQVAMYVSESVRQIDIVASIDKNAIMESKKNIEDTLNTINILIHQFEIEASKYLEATDNIVETIDISTTNEQGFFKEDDDVEQTEKIQALVPNSEALKTPLTADTTMEQMINKIYSEVAGLIDGSKYSKYSIQPSIDKQGLMLLQLFGLDGNLSAQFPVEIGNIISRGIFILIADNTGTCFYVPVEEKDILKRVFDNPTGFVPTDDDRQKCSKYLFKDTEVYRYIDLSNCPFVSTMSPDEYVALGDKLSAMLTLAKNNVPGKGNLNYKFRFSSFDSIDSFSLVSDDKVNYRTKDNRKMRFNNSIICNGNLVTITIGNFKPISFNL